MFAALVAESTGSSLFLEWKVKVRSADARDLGVGASADCMDWFVQRRVRTGEPVMEKAVCELLASRAKDAEVLRRSLGFSPADEVEFNVVPRGRMGISGAK